jgi:hypothetical protein
VGEGRSKVIWPHPLDASNSVCVSPCSMWFAPR